MLPALACGKGDLAESLKVEAYHPRMGKVVQETVRLEALSERPPAVDALEDFVEHAPDLKARALERCLELQRLLRNCDDAGSRKRNSSESSDSTVPSASWSRTRSSASTSGTEFCR